jgi:hypothetical protein
MSAPNFIKTTKDEIQFNVGTNSKGNQSVVISHGENHGNVGAALHFLKGQNTGSNYILKIDGDDSTGNLDVSGKIKTQTMDAFGNVFIDGNLTVSGDVSGNIASAVTSYFADKNHIFVGSKSDLPTPVGGIITLEAGKTYHITTDIDLTGDRLVTGGNLAILGNTSETSSITSTGLGTVNPLISSDYTLVLETITIKDVSNGFYINNVDENTVALDWENVNFSNVPSVGVINNCTNFIYDTGAFLNSRGLTISGELDTFAISDSVFIGDGGSGNIINIASNAIINRRFRMVYSSVVAFGSTVGINVDGGASIPTESYILDTINFSGGGTYLSGVDVSDNKALFVNCVGIDNTSVNGQMTMRGNSTATNITNSTNFFKVAGTTTASELNQKFDHSSNRLTCRATISRKYLVQCIFSFNTGNNDVCEFGFYNSNIGAVSETSKMTIVADRQNVFGNIIDIEQLEDGDFVELWCRNTDGANITVLDLNFIVTEFK